MSPSAQWPFQPSSAESAYSKTSTLNFVSVFFPTGQEFSGLVMAAIVNVTDAASFKTEVEKNRLTVVHFWASWAVQVSDAI